MKDFETGLDQALSDVDSSLSQLKDHDQNVAIAVSGGADSMALTHLLIDILGPERLVALTVDHGLRAEAKAEVEQVGVWLSALGVRHVPLYWTGEKPETGVQEAAREARYELMEEWCCSEGIEYLCLGHHRRDQAETFLLRLARGSGVWGLSAMAFGRPALISGQKKPYLLRPMLDMDAGALRGYLAQKSQPWVEDPSNQNLAFDRVKIREFLKQPVLDGFNEKRLASTAKALGRARAALDHYVGLESEQRLSWSSYGSVSFCEKDIADLPDEVALRILSQTIQKVAGETKVPRLRHLENWLMSIRGGERKGRTLGGCEILPADKTRLLVCREAAHISEELSCCEGATVTWDGRFEIKMAKVPPHSDIAYLGEKGWAQIKENGFDAPCAYKVALSQPALWKGEILCAAPTLGYFASGFEESLTARFIL